MKAVLLLFLFSLISCQLGGWAKRSLAENNLYIDRSFKEAFKAHSNNEDVDQDDCIRLSVYSQIVSGTNYKVCFLDAKADYLAIQEYVVYVPLPKGKRNGPEFNIIRHKELETGNLIDFNDATFSLVEKHLTQSLETTNEKVKYVSYVLTAENEETKFFIVTAETKTGEHKYVFSQDKNSKELEFVNKIK